MFGSITRSPPRPSSAANLGSFCISSKRALSSASRASFSIRCCSCCSRNRLWASSTCCWIALSAFAAFCCLSNSCCASLAARLCSSSEARLSYSSFIFASADSIDSEPLNSEPRSAAKGSSAAPIIPAPPSPNPSSIPENGVPPVGIPVLPRISATDSGVRSSPNFPVPK